MSIDQSFGDQSSERADNRSGRDGSGLAHARREARDGVENVAHEAQERLGDALDPLRDKVRKIADQQKETGADQMESLAKAAHCAADNLRNDLPLAADYIEQAAARLEHASTRVRDGDIDQLMDTCTDFARQRPAAFFGGAILAGFAVARFLRSSSPSSPTRRY